MKASAFFTRQASGHGTVKPIPFPNGESSEAEITIRGTDSDEFHTAVRVSAREKALAGKLPEGPERDAAYLTAHLRMMSALVADWTLEEECTESHVMELFREAPHIRDFVDKVSADRGEFFKMPSSD